MQFERKNNHKLLNNWLSMSYKKLYFKLIESLNFYEQNWNCFAFKEYLGRVCVRGVDKKFIYLQISHFILALFRGWYKKFEFINNFNLTYL
jgi:hypothetical protein